MREDGALQPPPEDLVRTALQSGDESAIPRSGMERDHARKPRGMRSIRFSTRWLITPSKIIKQNGLGEGLQQRLLEACQGREPGDEPRPQEPHRPPPRT